MARTSIFFIIITLAAAAAVFAQPQLNCKLDLKVGESVTVGSEGLVVGFDAVTGDSRCPIGVYCIWEGDAATRLWAEIPGQERETFDLHTHGGFKRNAVYLDYVISLVGVAPYPHIDHPIPPGDYVASLTVTCCSSASPVELTTWGRIKALYR
jgi:hypothetical protein